MSRDTAFWTMVIGFIVPGLTLGLFRGRAIGKTYRGIYADLKKAGIELSRADLELLLGQLNRNPREVLDGDGSSEAHMIKERHVDLLTAYLKSVRRYFYILVGAAVLALISFQHFWPNK